jgi:transcriptional regulator with XRE-family HTH domain
MAFGKKQREREDVSNATQEILVSIGERIGEARNDAGLTTLELAAKVGVSADVLERCEAGKQDPSRFLAEIARVTNKPVVWFLAECQKDLARVAQSEPVIEMKPLPRASEPPAPLPWQRGPEGASDAELDEQDTLDALMSSLARQKERLGARRAALEELERALAERAASLATRERVLAELGSVLDECVTKLEELEHSNREHAERAGSFAAWAQEARATLMSQRESCEFRSPEM